MVAGGVSFPAGGVSSPAIKGGISPPASTGGSVGLSAARLIAGGADPLSVGGASRLFYYLPWHQLGRQGDIVAETPGEGDGAETVCCRPGWLLAARIVVAVRLWLFYQHACAVR